MCQQFIRCHCQSFLLPVCSGTLQISGIIIIIIIVRFEKQKCSLLKDICVKKNTIIELEREGGKRYRFAESRIRVGSLKGHGFFKTYRDRNNTYYNQRKLNHYVFTCILISYWRNSYDIPYCSGLGFHHSFTLSISMRVVQLL